MSLLTESLWIVAIYWFFIFVTPTHLHYINIKVSLPSHGNGINFNNFIDSEDGSNENIRFFINEDIQSADGWLIFEDLKFENEKCFVPKENIIYLNNEKSFFWRLHGWIYKTI